MCLLSSLPARGPAKSASSNTPLESFFGPNLAISDVFGPKLMKGDLHLETVSGQTGAAAALDVNVSRWGVMRGRPKVHVLSTQPDQPSVTASWNSSGERIEVLLWDGSLSKEDVQKNYKERKRQNGRFHSGDSSADLSAFLVARPFSMYWDEHKIAPRTKRRMYQFQYGGETFEWRSSKGENAINMALRGTVEWKAARGWASNWILVQLSSGNSTALLGLNSTDEAADEDDDATVADSVVDGKDQMIKAEMNDEKVATKMAQMEEDEDSESEADGLEKSTLGEDKELNIGLADGSYGSSLSVVEQLIAVYNAVSPMSGKAWKGQNQRGRLVMTPTPPSEFDETERGQWGTVVCSSLFAIIERVQEIKSNEAAGATA